MKWYKNWLLEARTAANQVPEIRITDTKLYVSAVTLSNQDNLKLFKQLEFGFKWAVNWIKKQYQKANQAQNRYLDFLIGRSFQRVNRLFALFRSNEFSIGGKEREAGS